MAKRPLISICIPTYNRAAVLKETIESYVKNVAFDEDVEIVISDNASSDETELICLGYTKKYKNIRYYKNENNILDANFPLALDRGEGEYLKLMNDSLLITSEGLSYLKQECAKHKNDNMPLFFLGTKGFVHTRAETIKCESFDDFICEESFMVTAIQCFGSWREQWKNVKDRAKYSNLKLNQDDWTYQLLALYGKAVICTRPYYKLLDIGARKGYNWFEVHVTNYYTIMKPYVEKKLITIQALKKEKKIYLRGLRRPITKKYMKDVIPDWQFDTSGTSSILWRHFHDIPYFYFYIATFPIWGALISLKYMLKRFIRI